MRRGHAVAGFSLIEFAILLIIFGAIAAASTMLGGKWVEKEEHKASKLNTKTVEEALDAYRKVNGRLPCPADPTLTPDDANFGVEAAVAGTCTGGTPAAATAAGGSGNAVVGVIPTQTLGMGKNLVVDAWGNRFDYYVDKRMTADNAFTVYGAANTDIGDIEVRDASGGVRSAKAVYAVVSKGGNKRGAATKDGTAINTKTTDLLEQENNEYNATGTATARDNILVQAAPTDQFDDIVSFKTRAQMSTGTRVIRPANCLASSVNWTVGADSCSGSVAELVDGANATITDSSPLGVGQVTVSCDNGTLTQTGATCEPGTPCTAGTENWTVGGKNCSAAVGVLVHGASSAITDSAAPQTGGATITCTNGVKSQSGTTCFNQCAATAQNWDNGAGSACTATPAVLAHGASTSITDSTAPATGNVTVTCNDGALAQSGPTCSGANTCAATTLNWTVGANSCSAAVGSVLDGANSVITDATAGLSPAGSGSATATCTNGSFGLSSTSCNAQCAANTANWTVATAPCSVSHGIINHGASTTETDSTANSTGSVTLTCTNGVVSQSAASCSTTCVAGTENWTQGANSCTGARGAIAGGASAVVTDSTAPETGTVTATCSAATGTISQSAIACTIPANCAAQTVNWTVGGRNCSGSAAATNHGLTAAVTDSTPAPAPNGSGSATFDCSNGTFTVQAGATCNAQCSARAESWTVSSNTCDGATPALNDGQSTTVSDATSPTTGSVTMSCTNGTLNQSGASCVSAGLPQESIPPFEGDTSNPCVNTNYTVPAGVTNLLVQLWGAAANASGGYTQGYLSVTPGEILTLITGQKPQAINNGWATACGGGGASYDTYGGAGRSAIRRGATELMTAGGAGAGGSAFVSGAGGLGGGTTGMAGFIYGPQCSTTAAGGGTGSAGGAFGDAVWDGTSGVAFQGGNGAVRINLVTGLPTSDNGGAGGGGFFGGGGGGTMGTSCTNGDGGGGGSGYCGGAGVTKCFSWRGYGAGWGSGGGNNGRITVTPVSVTPDPVIFNSVGADQTYTVPAGTSTLLVQLWGAGVRGQRGSYYSWGAVGGYTQAYLEVSPGETLTIIAGSTSSDLNGYCSSTVYGGGGVGGFNASGWVGTCGAGRSAVRRGATELLTAGGAGGQGGGGSEGVWGGGSGADGGRCNLSSGVGAKSGGNGGAGGTCSTHASGGNGSLGLGGNGASGTRAGGGGGGGYPGGGGGSAGSSRGGTGAGGAGYCGGAGVSHCVTKDAMGAHGATAYWDGSQAIAVPAGGGKVVITPFP